MLARPNVLSIFQRVAKGASRDHTQLLPVTEPTTAFAEFDIVDVRGRGFLEQRQELILRTVETAHAGIGLPPHNEIERREAEFRSYGIRRCLAAPVDKSREHAAVRPAIGSDRLTSTPAVSFA